MTCAKTFDNETGVPCTSNITISATARIVCITYIIYVTKVEHKSRAQSVDTFGFCSIIIQNSLNCVRQSTYLSNVLDLNERLANGIRDTSRCYMTFYL